VWLKLGQIAGRVKIQPMILGKVMSSIRTKGGGDLGLNLKFDKKGFLIPGYSRKDSDGKWEFSGEALKVVEEYKEKFPVTPGLKPNS